jgi:GNAT superfamily N-acetyltransferase
VKRPPYRLREVDPTDDEVLDELQALHVATFGNTAPQPEYEKGFWWLAHQQGVEDPIGFAGLSPSKVWKETGYLERCGIMPGHRGQRLQQRFLRVREAKARKLGWVLLRSDTTDNVVSANNLIKAGYRLFVPRFPWGFKGTLYWRKEI